MTWRVDKVCPRCNGQLFTNNDGDTDYLSCLQCGYRDYGLEPLKFVGAIRGSAGGGHQKKVWAYKTELVPCIECGKLREVRTHKGEPYNLRCRTCANKRNAARVS